MGAPLWQAERVSGRNGRVWVARTEEQEQRPPWRKGHEGRGTDKTE